MRLKPILDVEALYDKHKAGESVTSLAAAAGISVSGLSRAFKRNGLPTINQGQRGRKKGTQNPRRKWFTLVTGTVEYRLSETGEDLQGTVFAGKLKPINT